MSKLLKVFQPGGLQRQIMMVIEKNVCQVTLFISLLSKGQALPPRQSMSVMPHVESVLSLPVTHGQADLRSIMGLGSRLSQ